MGDVPSHDTYGSRMKRLSYFGYGLVSLTLASFLSGCRASVPKVTSPSPSTNSTSEQPLPSSPTKLPATPSPTSSASSPATISEIQSQPVWLRRLKATREIPAEKGMGLQIGETIRTEGKALAQINLKNGLAFRIGGDAVLTLQPDNQLNLSAGEMITWVNPGQHVPAKVITPGGIAGIRGTTIYVKIPQAPNEAIEFFTWEGTMSIQLPNQPEEFQVKGGEIVKIRPGETDIRKIRASVRRLTDQEWLARRRNSSLINKFGKPLPTLQKIDKIAPPAAKTRSLTSRSTLSPTKLSTSPQKQSRSRPTFSPNKQIIPKVVTNTLTPTPKPKSTPQQQVPSKTEVRESKPKSTPQQQTPSKIEVRESKPKSTPQQQTSRKTKIREPKTKLKPGATPSRGYSRTPKSSPEEEFTK
ncbi:FecR family protein [Allocoleopsis sp.]|uniref:FecR family protein n=1 Tax=Allocoleopsis sp. TaxID=3088169 RepID=UPI002FD6A949